MAFHHGVVNKLNLSWSPTLLPSPQGLPPSNPSDRLKLALGFMGHLVSPVPKQDCSLAAPLDRTLLLSWFCPLYMPPPCPPPHWTSPSGRATLARQGHPVQAFPSVFLPPHPEPRVSGLMACLRSERWMARIHRLNQ